MKVAVLTAALQQIVSREKQDKYPLLPVLQWLELAKKIGCDGIELAAALHPLDSYVPAEAMLDPVADHLPLRQELSDRDAGFIIDWSRVTGVKIYDLGVFENLLHHDPAIRAKIHAHVLKAARAADKLRSAGCRGVAGFIGRDITEDMDQQLALFEERVIPLFREFKKLGLTYWVEPCPMPGWNTTDTYINNVAYCPGMWIALYKICEKHNVEDVFRITYDESHDILMGTSHHGSFSAMTAAGLPFVVSRFHGKDQVADQAKLAVWGYRGQTVLRGDRHDGKPDPDPRKQCNAWGVMTASHGLPGLVFYNPANMAARRQVDWLDHQLAARRVLGLDPEETVFIIEHEWGSARKQNLEMVTAILSASVEFIKGIDRAAAAMYQAETEICPQFSLDLPSDLDNTMYDILGLAEATALDPSSALQTAEQPEAVEPAVPLPPFAAVPPAEVPGLKSEPPEIVETPLAPPRDQLDKGIAPPGPAATDVNESKRRASEAEPFGPKAEAAAEPPSSAVATNEAEYPGRACD